MKFMKHLLLDTLVSTNSTHTFNDTSLEIILNAMSSNSPALALNAKSQNHAITFHLEPSCHYSLLKNPGKMFLWILLFTFLNLKHLMLFLSSLIVSPKWLILSLLRHRSTHLNWHNYFSTILFAYMDSLVVLFLIVILVFCLISGVNSSL